MRARASRTKQSPPDVSLRLRPALDYVRVEVLRYEWWYRAGAWVLGFVSGMGANVGPFPVERVCLVRRSDGRILWQFRGLDGGEGDPLREEIVAELSGQTVGQFAAAYNLDIRYPSPLWKVPI